MVSLFSSIHKDVIGHVTECETSFEIWKTLERLYNQASMARALQLKRQLNTLKKGSSSISSFVLRIKNLGAELRSSGQAVSESHLIQSVLNGLG
ncbi:hypothetical protein Sjap_024169 [Stephania japonica]|uniref:Retrotransposon gag domain-containing protein n=1 Tax=Stephania japonica TaxID=461633 RepID=A0AAP0EHP9_9MAGN